MAERREPDIDQVREALREHDERVDADEHVGPPEPPPADDEPAPADED